MNTHNNLISQEGEDSDQNSRPITFHEDDEVFNGDDNG